MSPVRLFVYGSLKQGQRHHSELCAARLLGPKRTATGYFLVLAGAYPGLVAGGRERVSGELYELDTRLLSDLDEFEGAAYERRAVRLEDGTEAQSYFLVGPAADAKPVTGGVVP